MPKMKTRRGAAKRFNVKKSGKIKCRRANRSHMLTHKATKRKRRLRGASYVPAGSVKPLLRQMPYA
jgi:large subunit ribosomal protein L35